MSQGASKTLCRYFLHGACSRGSTCTFAHDLKAKSNNVCKFYMMGKCGYGQQCRYDHVKATKITPHPPTDTSRMTVLKKKEPPKKIITLNEDKDWSSAPSFIPGKKVHKTTKVKDEDVIKEVSFSKMASFNVSNTTAENIYDEQTLYQEGISFDGEQNDLLCPFAAHRECPYGEECEYIHGEICDICGLQALHPTNKIQRKEHQAQCESRLEQDMKIAFAAQRSDGVTCSICMDAVKGKSDPSERYFGLLENCIHPFCLTCIRKWRSSSLDKNVVRTCPICREQSWFVTPSEFWIDDVTEKKEAIEGYKNYLNTKHCRLFDQGNGTCPFGTSCFYKHTYPDGREEERKPDLRYLEDGVGNIKIHKTPRLNEFIEQRE